MDRGSKQAMVIDATSVVSSFANLELDSSPFDLLPNKVLQQILSKVEQSEPIQKFAHLRSVDTRWRSVIDNICKDKKSLIVIIRKYEKFSSTTLQVEDLFFGLLEEADIMCVKIESQVEVDEDGDSFNVVNVSTFGSLLKALPNIEQLFVYCPDSNGIDQELAAYINSLFSLKKLYLYGHFEDLFHYLGRLKNRSLSRLELFFFNRHCKYSLMLNCVRCVAINFDYVRQLLARSFRWLANVTQLSVPIGFNDVFDQVVHSLHEHATGLNVLYIKFCDTSLITPKLFGHLGKLTQLREIALGPVNFEVLKQVSNAIELNELTPLITITTCNLVICDFRPVKVDQFNRFLRAIFPHVFNWKFAFLPKALDTFVTKLKQNSNLTYYTHPNVRRCKILENTVDEFFELLNVSTYF